MVRPPSFVALLLFCSFACADGGNGALPAVDPDARELCEPSEVFGPRIPLQATRDQELILPVGALPTQLAFDYRVEFPYWATAATMTYDFDRTLGTQPATSVFDGPCPEALQLNDIMTGLPDEGVYSGLLAVTDEQTGSYRETRLSFARGSRTISLKLPEIPSDAGTAWLLFEPAAGRSRVAIAAAAWGELVTVEGLPPGAAEVAIVASADIVFEDGGIYAPSGFSEGWRASVSPWYGSVLGPDVGAETVPLARVRGVDDAPMFAPGLQESISFPDGTKRLLIPVLDRSRNATVEVPCPASVLEATVFGFGEVSSGEQSAARGKTLDIPLDCAEDESLAIDISVVVQNQRVVTLLLEYAP